MRYFRTAFFGLLALLLMSCQPEDKFYVAYCEEATGLFGMKDQSGKVIFPPQYEYIEGAPSYEYSKGDSQYENLKDKKLFHPSNPNTEYLVFVKKKGKFFRMTKDGILKFQSTWEDNGPGYYDQGLTRFLENSETGVSCNHMMCGPLKKVGFHNKKGEIVIPARYDYAGPFRNGYTFVCNGCWKETRKNLKFETLSNTPYLEKIKEGENSYDDTSLKGGLWGAVDLSGKEVVPLTRKDPGEVKKVLEKKFGWVYGIVD